MELHKWCKVHHAIRYDTQSKVMQSNVDGIVGQVQGDQVILTSYDVANNAQMMCVDIHRSVNRELRKVVRKEGILAEAGVKPLDAIRCVFVKVRGITGPVEQTKV